LAGSENEWKQPDGAPVLLSGEIHVWLASLDWSPQGVDQIRRFLSEDEQKRSQSFYFPKDARHYTVARGLLRVILGNYIGVKPDMIEFCYNRYGKPTLEKTFAGDQIRFNVSHSHGKALIAVSQYRSLGVDIEFIRPNPERLKIADRFFSEREAALLRTLPKRQQEEGFYLCWTRKEAYIKAAGKGLSIPLDQFDVSLEPGNQAALLRNDLDPAETARWLFYSLPPTPGWALALVAEGEPADIKCWEWVEGMRLPDIA
jgi:4'-phosphopantetheinyl transferase